MLKGFFASPQVEQRAQATTWGEWQGDLPPAGQVQVNELTAMQLLAVAGCVKLITDSIATLPVDVYRRDSAGQQFEVEEPTWLAYPTVDLDFTAWCTQVLTSLLLHGNAFLDVRRTGSRITEIPVVDPMSVTVYRDRGMKRYRINGQPYDGEIVHIKGMMLPGADVGLSPLEYARQSIGLGLEALSFGSDQFQQSLNMPGVIEIPKRAQPEQMQAMAQAWRRARARRGRGLPGVLEDGATWRATGVTNEQAQFLQLRQWTAAEIAAQVYMVDPADLGIPVAGTSLTYANLEQRNIRRVQVTFLPWMVRIEKALSMLLPQPRYMKFNVDGLLRGDSSTRWQIYATASTINSQAATYGQGPVLTTTEMRDFEDLNALPDTPPAPTPPPPADSQLNSAPPINVTIHMPEQRFEGPTVNVTPDIDVNMPEQQPPNVTIRQDGPQIEVMPQVVIDHSPQPEVVEAPTPRMVRRNVERDELGRIATIIDEVI
jgi:HK97 family phage portal protein